MPMAPVDHALLAAPPAHHAQLTWVGHATFLLQVSGVTVLTDPICSERCSPVQFVGPKRFAPAALSVDRLPQVDLVLIRSVGNSGHRGLPLALMPTSVLMLCSLPAV